MLDLFTGRPDLVDGTGEPALIAELTRVHSLLGLNPTVAVQRLRLVQASFGRQ